MVDTSHEAPCFVSVTISTVKSVVSSRRVHSDRGLYREMVARPSSVATTGYGYFVRFSLATDLIVTSYFIPAYRVRFKVALGHCVLSDSRIYVRSISY